MAVSPSVGQAVPVAKALVAERVQVAFSSRIFRVRLDYLCCAASPIAFLFAKTSIFMLLLITVVQFWLRTGGSDGWFVDVIDDDVRCNLVAVHHRAVQ